MTTRQTIEVNERNPVDRLETGYEGNSVPEDFTIPSCGLEDVDRALHKLFDEELGFQIRKIQTRNDGTKTINKPFVIMATGERFALTKRLKPIRDTKGALILPAIAIRRTGIEQTVEDIGGRGINQNTGTLIIKKRLDSSDRNYQSFINKLALKNSDLPNTRKLSGSFGPQNDLGTYQGSLLDPHLGNNIWEIISIPQPQFWTQTYEVTFWTNYTQHMNYMIETMFSSFLPQGKEFYLKTDKGYWFIAYVDDSIQSSDNFDDFTEQDKLNRYTFSVKVKSFLLAANGPGNKVPIKRTVYSPQITFDLIATNNEVFYPSQLPEGHMEDKFILSDIESDENQQDPTSLDKILATKDYLDPRTGKVQKKTVKILQANQKAGETTYYASNVTSLEDFISLLK